LPICELLLIGRRHIRSNNSWLHNSRRLVKGPQRCTLMLNPVDAERLGIADGGEVQVQSRVGRRRVTAEITDELMPGVVSLPHGWCHDAPGIGVQGAQRAAGVSFDALTDDQHIDRLTGNAALNGVPVRVVAIAGRGGLWPLSVPVTIATMAVPNYMSAVQCT